MPCSACCTLCFPYSLHKTGICIHRFCPWGAALAHPSAFVTGATGSGAAPGPVLSAKKEIILSDVRSIKLPRKSHISKAHTQGSGPPAGFLSLPLPGALLGAAGGEGTSLTLPEASQFLFYTIILLEKLIWPMQALENPCALISHRKSAHHTCTHPQIPQLTFQSWLKNSALPLNTKIDAILPFLSAPSASRVAFEPH